MWMYDCYFLFVIRSIELVIVILWFMFGYIEIIDDIIYNRKEILIC